MMGKLSLLSAELRGFRDGFSPSEIPRALSTMHRFHAHKTPAKTKLFISISHSESCSRLDGAIRVLASTCPSR